MRIGEAEPVYQGTPLGEWVRWTEDQEIDGSPSVAAANAAAAIKAIGPAKVIPFLLRWMNSPKSDSVILCCAVKCFQILGPEARSAIPELAEMLNQPVNTIDESGRAGLAAEALSYLGPDAVPIIIAAANKERRGKWKVISLIANFAFDGRDAVPDVLNWSKSSDGSIRFGALHAYIGIEENKQALITFLLSALRDTEWSVRRDAARSLGDVAKGRPEVSAALFEVLRDPHPQSVTGAILALGRLGMEREKVVAALVEKLHDNEAVVRRCAALALGDVAGTEAFSALVQATDDPDGFVREAVFQSLKRIDAEALARSGKKFY